MAFSTRRSGGGWAHSLLPYSSTTSSTPKPRKYRKRAAFRDFFISNFFTIGLTFSLLLFFYVIYRYGVPRPLISTHFKESQTRFHRTRKPISRKPDNVSGASAIVDITTKQLYDKIEFLDEDGGPWKQGWKVQYKGNEWDDEKLKVFVVPHSHNDPGWKFTVEEYYQRQSKHILDTIVESLSKDPRRKFIWEEMSYLERWWRDATESNKESFINLVHNGQLEIVGGGWVMNDEANSHYFAIIEQIMEGNTWLNDTIGIIPKNSWAIDPFGYSPTMAYLFKRMGFENMLIQRTHYELKKELSLHKNLEYIWRQSWDVQESTDIFVHMMPFYSYDIPHTCGPEPSVCCQFDFARMPGSGPGYEACPWGLHPVEITQENVKEKALLLLDQYKKKSTLYRTNTILIPLGDDFRYVNIDEAEVQFRNYQKIFDYINNDLSLKTEAKFGTLEDYFKTLREESERVDYKRVGEVGSTQINGFPVLSGDFFTYADREKDYWSGYYVSRPFFKAIDRVLEQTLRGSEILMSFLLSYCQRVQCEKLPLGFSYKLTAARRNLALFQHHDGVTGTAKDHVVLDYGTRMFLALQDLQIFMAKSIEVLLGFRLEKNDQTPSQFEAFDVKSNERKYKVMSARLGTVQTVVIFNPLEQIRHEVIMVIVERPDVTILDSNWTCVKSQISPEFEVGHVGPVFSGKHRVYWKSSVPGLGLQTYYVANGFVGCEKAKSVKIKIFSEGENFNNLKCPVPYNCEKIESSSEKEEVEIKNEHQRVIFNVKTGLMKEISGTHVEEELSMYSSTGGAYLFKPNGEAENIVGNGGLVIVLEGNLVQEVFSLPKTKYDKSPISHSTRIYNCEGTIQDFIIEKEYHVELTGQDFNDKELITRFKTGLDNKKVFYTDLNGFQTIRRETYTKIPLQGNYYPMPSLAFLQGYNGQRFSIHTRQSLGVASLENGWLEIMLDRRLVSDDGRGLGQGVMDNRPMNVLFHLTLEGLVGPTGPPVPSLQSHLVGAHLNYPMHIFIAKQSQEISVQPPPRYFSPLSNDLPCDLHIVSFKVPRPLKYNENGSNGLNGSNGSKFMLTLRRYGFDLGYCKKAKVECSRIDDVGVNLFEMFKGITVIEAKGTSLTGLHDEDENLGYNEVFLDGAKEGNVIISPMEIQAYKLTVKQHQ